MKLRFSDFVLDEDRFVLEQAGARIALRPKAFDLLLYLVNQRARVVRREELVELLWRGMAVGPGSLSGLVNELRQALGENGREPSSIRTVHARGYQFNAPVEVLQGNGDASEIPSVLAVRDPRPSRLAQLLERVTEDGARGVLLSAGPPSVAEQGGRGRTVSDLEVVLAAAEAARFELQAISVPDESMATSARWSRSLVDALEASRGREAVRLGLPLPARLWFEQRSTQAVAGGRTASTLGPPGGLSAVASLISVLARRRPIAWVLEGVDRGGAGLARDLSGLVEKLSSAPVLIVGTVRPGGANREPVRALARDIRFENWLVPGHGHRDLSGRLEALGYSPLPAVLSDALVAHVGGDPIAVEEIAAWICGHHEVAENQSPRRMRSVPPRERVDVVASGEP